MLKFSLISTRAGLLCFVSTFSYRIFVSVYVCACVIFMGVATDENCVDRQSTGRVCCVRFKISSNQKFLSGFPSPPNRSSVISPLSPLTKFFILINFF